MLILAIGMTIFCSAQEVKLGLPTGHIGEIIGSDFSADGKYVLTASKDKTAKLFEVETGILVQSFEGHFDALTEAHFIEKDQKVLTVSLDGTAKIFDIHTAKLLQSLDNEQPISRLLISDDERHIVTLSEMGSPTLFNLKTGKKIILGRLITRKYESLFEYGVDDVVLSNRMLVMEWDRGRVVLDLDQYKQYKKIADQIEIPRDLLVSDDGPTLFLSGAKGRLLAFNLRQEKLVYQSDSLGKIRSINALPEPDLYEIKTKNLRFVFDWNKQALVSKDSIKPSSDVLKNPRNSYQGNTATIDNTPLPTDLQERLLGKNNPIYTLTYNPDQNNILLASKFETSQIDLVTGHTTILEEHEYQRKQKSFVSSSKSGKFSVGENKIWINYDGHLIWHHAHQIRLKYATQIAFTKDEQSMYYLDVNKLIKLEIGSKWDQPQNFNPSVDKIAYDADYKEHVVIPPVGEADIVSFQPAVERLVHEYAEEKYPVKRNIVFSDDGTRYAVFSVEHIWLYDSKTDSLISKISDVYYDLPQEALALVDGVNNAGHINSCSFSSDSKTLVVSGTFICLFDVETGKLVRYFKETQSLRQTIDGDMSDENINCRYLKNQKYFVSSGNGTNVYSARTGKVKHKFNTNRYFEFDAPDLKSQLYSLNHDESRILVASSSEEAKVFDLKTGKLIFHFTDHKNTISSAQYTKDRKYIITSSLDGSFILYNAETGEQVIRYFKFEGREDLWVHLHPDGFFDASEKAMELMYWTRGLDVIDFTQLKDRFWVPGLWQKVMKNEPMPDAAGLAEIYLEPKVILGEVNDQTLPIELVKRDGGYGKVTILINGKEVNNDIRGSLLDSSLARQTINYSIANHPYLKYGDNTIEVQASSEDQIVQGKGVTVNYVVTNKEQRLPEFYAVVIGVGEYANDQINLTFPPNDAHAMETALKLGAENLFGIDRTHVYKLSTDIGTSPTKTNIANVFREIGKTANPEDIIFIYLSGHGITLNAESSDFYFLTTEARSASKSTYSDTTLRNRYTISTSEFIGYLKGINALKQVMVIDACGSGTAVETYHTMASRDIDGSQIKAFDRMKDRMGMYIISGCASDMVSYETSIYGQGLLTYSILEAMRGGVRLRESRVDIVEVMNYAREKVPVLAKGIGGVQTPQLLIPQSGSFDIGILLKEDQINIPLASPKTMFVQSVFINPDSLSDNLNISDLVDQFLGNEQRQDELNIGFVESKTYPSSCKISGVYTQGDSTLNARIKINCGSDNTKIYNLIASDPKQLLNRLEAILKESGIPSF